MNVINMKRKLDLKSFSEQQNYTDGLELAKHCNEIIYLSMDGPLKIIPVLPVCIKSWRAGDNYKKYSSTEGLGAVIAT